MVVSCAPRQRESEADTAPKRLEELSACHQTSFAVALRSAQGRELPNIGEEQGALEATQKGCRPGQVSMYSSVKLQAPQAPAFGLKPDPLGGSAGRQRPCTDCQGRPQNPFARGRFPMAPGRGG